jgi:hypothetical protein
VIQDVSGPRAAAPCVVLWGDDGRIRVLLSSHHRYFNLVLLPGRRKCCSGFSSLFPIPWSDIIGWARFCIPVASSDRPQWDGSLGSSALDCPGYLSSALFHLCTTCIPKTPTKLSDLDQVAALVLALLQWRYSLSKVLSGLSVLFVRCLAPVSHELHCVRRAGAALTVAALSRSTCEGSCSCLRGCGPELARHSTLHRIVIATINGPEHDDTLRARAAAAA